MTDTAGHTLNAIRHIHPQSTLWHLVPGINNITLTGTTVVQETTCVVDWDNLYSGAL